MKTAEEIKIKITEILEEENFLKKEREDTLEFYKERVKKSSSDDEIESAFRSFQSVSRALNEIRTIRGYLEWVLED